LALSLNGSSRDATRMRVIRLLTEAGEGISMIVFDRGWGG
jgi:hypothetical protein